MLPEAASRCQGQAAGQGRRSNPVARVDTRATGIFRSSVAIADAWRGCKLRIRPDGGHRTRRTANPVPVRGTTPNRRVGPRLISAHTAMDTRLAGGPHGMEPIPSRSLSNPCLLTPRSRKDMRSAGRRAGGRPRSAGLGLLDLDEDAVRQRQPGYPDTAGAANAGHPAQMAFEVVKQPQLPDPSGLATTRAAGPRAVAGPHRRLGRAPRPAPRDLPLAAPPATSR
jgi:hypothetical protein